MADKKISQLSSASTPLAGTEVLPIVQSNATVKVSVDNLTAGKTVPAGKFSATSTDTILLDARRTVANNTCLLQTVDSPGTSNCNYLIAGIDTTGGSVGYSSGGVFVSTGANGTGTARSLILHTYGNNDIVFARQNTQIASISANGFAPIAGKGIDFSANGGDVLTQYDEGTWNVTWSGVTGTPSNTTAYYTRIGRTVFFTYAAGATPLTGVGATTYFTLPFTPGVTAVGQMLSENITASGTTLLLTNGRCYPSAFSSSFMVFSGTFNV